MDDGETIEWIWPGYELIDFGHGRKLEKFEHWLLDRPCPAAAGIRPKCDLARWAKATARYEGERAAAGKWAPDDDLWGAPRNFCIPCLEKHLPIHLVIEPLPSGQIGVFPEQFECWQWISSRVGAAAKRNPIRVLNLFAYTGASTLAAAAGGAEVVHVDAAKSVVARARQNAEVSELADRPIRWIVEDAVKFCRREVKRGNRYDAVILDPPTYGHGPKGEEWLINRDLLPLLELCGELTERRPKFVLATCHSPGIGPAELSAYVSDGFFGSCGQPPRCGELFLETRDGRRLASGVFARWPG